jgi:hypothetical protein
MDGTDEKCVQNLTMKTSTYDTVCEILEQYGSDYIHVHCLRVACRSKAEFTEVTLLVKMLGGNQQRFPCEGATRGSNRTFFFIVARPVVYAHVSQGD